VPDVVIRPVTPEDDFDAQVDLGQRAFGIYSPAQKASWLYAARLRARQGMFLGAFAGQQPAGAAIFHDLRQWWAGRAVPCAGVASVKVAPEYRGHGTGRRLMTELLAAIAARGYPLAALYPATMPIYRSLGWELAGGRYRATIPARSLRDLLAPDAAVAAGPVSSPAATASAPDAGRLGADSSPSLTVGARGLAALYAGTPVSTLRLAVGGAPDTGASLDAAFAATPFMVDEF
jgi:predicted N-acetyltransferase YhbS